MDIIDVYLNILNMVIYPLYIGGWLWYVMVMDTVAMGILTEIEPPKGIFFQQ